MRWIGLVSLTVLLIWNSEASGLKVEETPQGLKVEGKSYRARFVREVAEFSLEVLDAQGQFRPVSRWSPEFGLVMKGEIATNVGARAEWNFQRKGDILVVGWGFPFFVPETNSNWRPVWATAHFLCLDDGILMRFQLHNLKLPANAVCWVMPRWRLDERLFDAYTFWRPDDVRRSGHIAALGERLVYAGVTPWEQRGDIAPAFAASLPALIVRSEATGVGLGIVFVRYAEDWKGGFGFLQRFRPDVVYLYSGYLPAQRATQGVWAWVAPFDGRNASPERKVQWLLEQANALLKTFKPIVTSKLPSWAQPPSDFPTELRRPRPVERTEDAVVFSINEFIHTPYGLWLARKVGSDVLLRAWFKWGNAPDWRKFSPLVEEAHRLGMLFGGGTTCSALYHGENNLSEEEVLDMATRDPEGRLVDAWGQAGVRHGTLSNPRYLNYILRWCQAQIEAGADCLFMDEINAALHDNEGYDDYSLRDFREHLIRTYVQGQGWRLDDPRWQERFRIDLTDRTICPDGTIATFDYRAYLKRHGLVSKPLSSQNPLREEWQRFRAQRDREAWRWLVERIREFARQRGRQVFICANGIAPFVDFQVRGVWDLWRVKEGRVDLSASQIRDWARIVRDGWFVAGRKVPVVFFHDWGFGGFPWMEVPPSDRELWMRVRGAEIYAAGGFFAFPVTGLGNHHDALRDGTLNEIARQTVFYQRYRDLYRNGIPIAFDELPTEPAQVSTALWVRQEPPTLLIHIINCRVVDFRLQKGPVTVWVPIRDMPQDVSVFSPDGFQGKAILKREGERIRLTLPQLEAYCVVTLRFKKMPRWSPDFVPRLYPTQRWERALENSFVVQPGGIVEDDWKLVAFLQGKLHTHLRNPPTFLINAPQGGTLEVFVRGVAQGGARLVLMVDGQLTQAVELPDRDGKNDPFADEYARTFTFRLPVGKHRITLDNDGNDWAFIEWLAFRGEFAHP
ncbi:hypothetical protein HRbin17_02251 [bacterium HR17]|uniref:Uncharacterized protein n=1 Tax=Candidatus Fervidibacter japonicus TaxID=2035412 RepID=A0A2H5XEW4_9BACT|nr:hypothetical protein HRbin17_02251 [bacterium HR17]